MVIPQITVYIDDKEHNITEIIVWGDSCTIKAVEADPKETINSKLEIIATYKTCSVGRRTFSEALQALAEGHTD